VQHTLYDLCTTWVRPGYDLCTTCVRPGDHIRGIGPASRALPMLSPRPAWHHRRARAWRLGVRRRAIARGPIRLPSLVHNDTPIGSGVLYWLHATRYNTDTNLSARGTRP